ncbi:UNVERIFIED_ORG: hypothetical protein J3D58_004158 [Paenarthrobacter nicotinovorans]
MPAILSEAVESAHATLGVVPAVVIVLCPGLALVAPGSR